MASRRWRIPGFTRASRPIHHDHDAAALITVSATTWPDQFEELWSQLVPPGGAASTEQGEAIRIAGKLSREILDNGAINWNSDFGAMADQLVGYLSNRITVGSAREVKRLGALVRRGVGDKAELYRLTELTVAWVLANPRPVPLGSTSYRN
jgi:hypothetical protein